MCWVCGEGTTPRVAESSGFSGGGMTPALQNSSTMSSQVSISTCFVLSLYNNVISILDYVFHHTLEAVSSVLCIRNKMVQSSMVINRYLLALLCWRRIAGNNVPIMKIMFVFKHVQCEVKMSGSSSGLQWYEIKWQQLSEGACGCGIFPKVFKALWNPLALSHKVTELYVSVKASCCAS